MKNKSKSLHNRKTKRDYETAERILGDTSSFHAVETYKSIRTNIMFSLAKSSDAKVIAVTSSAPGEGKTTTSINLAITFAEMGARVLLMDCDLRKSRVHRYLELARQDGVTNVLCGFVGIDEAIKTGIRPNLDVLTGGEIPPNPAELLEAEEFTRLLDELKTRYDYIFIDTPPITVVTDATIVMKHCVGVAVVVRKDITSFHLLDATMNEIAKTEAKPLGFVLLGSADAKGKYGSYKKSKYAGKGYDYKYGYSYGDSTDGAEEQ